MLGRFRSLAPGLKHWAMELIVVVAGVFIALSVQQWAENYKARERAKQADERIRQELAANLVISVERIALDRCIKEQLTQAVESLRRGSRNWAVQEEPAGAMANNFAFGRNYRVPSRTWVADEYEAARATGALEVLPAERAQLLAASYSSFGNQGEINDIENELGTKLTALQFDSALTPTERRAMLATLTRLDFLNGLQTIISQQAIERARLLRFRLRPEELDLFREQLPPELQRIRAIYGDCVDDSAFAFFDPSPSPSPER